MAYWNNDDTINYGGANRPFQGYEHKPNGLALGDEFFMPAAQISSEKFGNGIAANYLATPIENVLCGTPLTAFANQYRKRLDLVDNPYKNYVTSIAIKPGDVLDGRQVGGKIFVNFTEPFFYENEFAQMDAIHTYWINLAYSQGAISLATRDQYLAQKDLLETQLSEGRITQAEYNVYAKWQENGMFILSQAEQIENADAKDDWTGGKGKIVTRVKTNKFGIAGTQRYSFNSQFFAFTFARQYPQIIFEAISMNTRGLRWLSDRVEGTNQAQTHVAMPASAVMIQPVITAVKPVDVLATPMQSIALHVDAVGFTGANRNILVFPAIATATMTHVATVILAAPMTAVAAEPQNVTVRTTASDQVILYVFDENAILYLREDIIK